MSGDRTLAPVGRRLLDVVAHRRLGAYDLLTVEDPDGPVPDPGQFYLLAAAERWGGGEDERPFLPRAFSVARWHAEDCRADFFLEDVGPGTERLGELRPGDGIWVLGPLGIGFTAPRDGRRPILVGGGIGIAPLAIWGDRLGGAALTLLGFRDEPHARGAEVIPGARVATDDGSVGHHGLVTDLLRAELGATDVRTPDPAPAGSDLQTPPSAEVYACGPPPMLEAVRALCEELGVPAQLALESGMACGFGACFGCVVPTRDGGYARLCVDGPVLDAADLEEVGHP